MQSSCGIIPTTYKLLGSRATVEQLLSRWMVRWLLCPLLALDVQEGALRSRSSRKGARKDRKKQKRRRLALAAGVS